MRLKLFLTMLWIGSGPPHQISGVAAAWARLLDLDDPGGRGARQIRSAMSWLESRELIHATGKSGAGMSIQLRSELGDGAPYHVPGRRLAEARENELEADRRDFYFRLPETFWTHGWIHNLSGAAIAALLILLEARRGAAPERPVWFSQRVADNRYVISEETRGKGFAELQAYELVEVSTSVIQSDALGTTRTRHAYRVIDGAFDGVPWLEDA